MDLSASRSLSPRDQPLFRAMAVVARKLGPLVSIDWVLVSGSVVSILKPSTIVVSVTLESGLFSMCPVSRLIVYCAARTGFSIVAS
jgi:hypothetical protein